MLGPRGFIVEHYRADPLAIRLCVPGHYRGNFLSTVPVSFHPAAASPPREKARRDGREWGGVKKATEEGREP